MKKRIVALFLAVLMLSCLGLTACKKKVTGNDSSSDIQGSDNGGGKLDWNIPESSSADNTESEESSSEVSITVSEAEKEKEKLDLKGGSIKLLTHWDPNTSDSRLLKSRFKEYCNGNIVFITTAYENLGEKLAALVMSNDSPDVYMVRNWDFPSLMYKDVFAELDSHIDFNSNIWKANKQNYDSLLWGGKHYIIGGAGPSSFLWYNKRLMEEAGVDKDPGELVAEGNWNWDTFLELAKKLTDASAGVYGFSETGFNYALMSAYGEDIIKISSAGIQSNVKSANVTKAMNFYSDLYTKYKVASTSDNRIQDFANGKVAMMYDGHWYANAEPIKTLHDKGEVTFTHIPMAPDGKEYIYPAEIGGYAMCKGAKNVDGAIAFLTMGQIQKAYEEEENKKWHETSNHNAQEIIVTDQALKEYKRNPIYSYGINDASRAYWDVLTSVRTGTSWSTLAEALNPKINKAIDDLSK